jgi:TonB family protein
MTTLARRDVERLAIAVAAAVLLHAGVYFAVPAIVRLQARERTYGPVTIHLELSSPLAVVEPLPPPQTVSLPEEVARSEAAVPEPQPAPVRPVAKATPKPAPAAPAIRARPTERAAAAVQQLAADPNAPITRRSGPAFQQVGPRTGNSAVEAPVPGPEPTLPVTPRSTTPTSPTAGQQRSGTAVDVGGRTSSAPLDSSLQKLDKSLSTAGTAAGSSTGSSTSGTPGGSAPAATAVGTGSPGITWEQPAAGRDRALVSAPLPKLPAWVSEQGLTLTVRVSFTVAAEGNITQARIAQGSGYSDVDAAVLDAVMKWRFSPEPGAAAIRGSVPYTIRPR